MSTKFSPNRNSWIQEIARGETSAEANELDQIAMSAGAQQAVEESTIEFLSDLRADFQDYVRIFNALSDSGKKFNEIKLFNLTQGAVDFMLYRNGMKLVIANTSHGVIQFSYQKHQATQNGVSAASDIPHAEEILAQVGVFETVQWTCRSERVESEVISKYFFSEFVRMTREQKKVKPDQKVLLNHIKALLEEQGLSLE